MFFSYAFGVLVLALVLLRQTRIRPVPRRFTIRLPIVVGVIGLFDLFRYVGDHHHLSGDDYLWLLGTLAVGAAALGALRALTVRVWTTGNWVVRQGTGLTMALWVVSLALHFFVDDGGGHAGASGLEQSSFLLYIALTIGVQAAVIHRRAVPLWNQLGPDAGRRFSINLGSGPQGLRTFFANFGSGSPGFDGPAAGRHSQGGSDIIDVEVVEDDDRRELPGPSR